MNLIDVHTHVVPQAFPHNPAPDTEPRWPCMACEGNRARVMIGGRAFRELDARSWDVETRIRDMDAAGAMRQALSPMPELLSYWFEPSNGREMCRWVNDTIAAMVAVAPRRFSGLGCVPLQDPAMAAAELTRLRADGFAGVEIGSNINGAVLGDPRFDEFHAEAESLGMAIFVHALHPIGAERLSDTPDLVPLAAFPLDTALSAASLIRGGVPVRYPELRIGFSHGGGAIVPLAHRLGQGWRLRDGFEGSLPESPAAYAARFYYDSLVYDGDYLRHLAEVFAPGQVFGGTDYPYVIMDTDLAASLAKVDGAHGESVRHEAAERFLGLSSTRPKPPG